MKNEKLLRVITLTFVMLVAYVVCCVAFMGLYAAQTLNEIAEGNKAHAASFVPAKRLSNDFEREILNARIFFIYFVTIQKPESLEKGWIRYHNAEARLKDLAALIDQHAELANLTPGARKLQQDVADYGVALTATLNMVQGGELKGAHYDAQVKEWAARGAVMVQDAGDLEKLTFKSSEANTNDVAAALHGGQEMVAFLLLASIGLCVVLTMRMHRRIRTLLEGGTDVGPPSIDGVGSARASVAGFGNN